MLINYFNRKNPSYRDRIPLNNKEYTKDTKLNKKEHTFIPKKGVKYTFIHPTKCGGTALELHFQKYYSSYIHGTGHNNIASSRNNPIIVIRDPIDRIISMYKYWKNGATDTKYKRDNQWLEKTADISISEFIDMIISKDRRLKTNFTWEAHYASYRKWLNPRIWKNTIVIVYKSNLNESMHKLLKLLNIKHKNETLPIKNKTKSLNENTKLTVNDMKRLKQYFEYDFELFDAILNQSDKFLYVIK